MSVIVLTVCHRGLTDETAESLQALGAPALKVKGEACIDRARSIAFDKLVLAFQKYPELDVALCVDDDMVFTPLEAQQLVDECRSVQWPISARYAQSGGALAAHPGLVEGVWFTGLGFMALPRLPFLRVADTLPREGDPVKGTRRWCRTGAMLEFPDVWVGEDYHFCSLFSQNGVRGVLLSNVTVGHLKPRVIRPSLGETGASSWTSTVLVKP